LTIARASRFRVARVRRRSTAPAWRHSRGSGADGAREPLKTAGEIVALLAGVVALLYVLGGAVLAPRLLFDNFGLDAVVNLIGQLPREFVITAGFVEAVAPALVVGLLSTIAFGIRNGPRRRAQGDRLDRGPHWKRILLALAGVSVLLVLPALLLALEHHQAWETRAAVVAIPITFGLVLPGWWVIRQIGKTRWLRFPKAVAGGLVWTGMALVPAVVFAGGVEFERARICVTGDATAVTGFLIADTKDRVLLGNNKGDVETVSSFPSRVVRHIQYGDLPASLDCSATPP
jgi:hypothetical protein